MLYVYIGYPLLLNCLRYVLPQKNLHTNIKTQPSVTLLISCFNEEKVIEAKLINSLNLDYPKEKIEIIVVSDASNDNTDKIVKSFDQNQIRLVRQDERLGKSLGLNLGIAKSRGEIVVFSDANAMYEPDAILRLIERFGDERVGYVVGEARYRDSKSTAAGKSEGLYWRYEIALKKLESQLHSIVGGDGAIYAIRRELYEDLQDSDINDFVNPLQIIAKGFRGVYAPEAVCWEESAGVFRKEFKRKVRIVNRAFSGLLRVKTVLNPLQTGFFAVEIWSHKLLRWFTPFILLVFVFSSFALSIQGILIFKIISWSVLTFCWLSYAGYLFSKNEINLPIFYYPYYFMIVNIASAIGVIRSLRGKVQVVWNPTRVNPDPKNSLTPERVIVHGIAWVSFVAVFIISGEFVYIANWHAKFSMSISFILLLYVYFGYPLVLSLLVRLLDSPVCQNDKYTPDVTMLICAYNEDEVIEQKIQNCLRLDYPASKIKFVIASDGSTDRTAEIVKRYENERFILFDYTERQGKIGAILATVPEITTDIIIFSDANTMYSNRAVRNLVRNFSDSSVGGVSADVILTNEDTSFGKSESLYYKYERWIQMNESRGGSIIGADGGMYAIRSELFLAPSNNIILDDFVISMNVALQGKRLIYDGDAIGYEKNVNSCYIEFLKKSRVVAGAVQAIKQNEGIPDPSNPFLFFCYVSHKLLRWHVPIFLILLFILNAYLLWVTKHSVLYLSFVLQCLFYLMAFFGSIIPGKIKSPIFYIPFYFCLVNGAALFGLYKGWFNKQNTKWRVFSRL